MVTPVTSALGLDDFEAEMDADPIGLLTRLREDGPVSVIALDDSADPNRLIIAFHPPLIEATLVHGVRTHRGLLRDLVGSGLFVVASGEQWHRRRDLLRPMFTTRAVAARHHLVLNAVQGFLDRALLPTAGVEFDLGWRMQRLSIEVILGLVDPSLTGQLHQELATALHGLVEYLDLRLFRPDSLTTADDEQFETDKARLVAFMRERGTLDGSADHSGVLGELAERVRSTDLGDEHPEDVIREEILSVFVAGVETMGALLTWIILNLSRNSSAHAQCLGEALGADLPAIRAAPALPRDVLPYTRAVVAETLRLYPPAWALFRTLPTPIEVDGIALRAGDQVLAATFATHRHPDLWDEPDEFRPDRFIGRQPPAQQYLPFGAGPHQCLGRQFSLVEAQLVTAALLEAGTFELCGDENVALRPGIALTPDPSPRAVFRPHLGPHEAGPKK